ncbi:MAG: metallophosphoesterase [Pseudomonadota bacterium]
MVRFLLVILVLSALMFAYPVWRITGWLDLPDVIRVAVTVPAFFSQVFARFALRKRKGMVAYVLRGAADLFLGLAPVLLFAVFGAELALLLVDLPTAAVGWTVILVVILALVWGLATAWRPKVVKVELKTNKLSKALRFVQISDVHIGSRSKRFLDRVMGQVAALNPDFLCITGDFIDQSGISVDTLSALRKLDAPIYFCTGNHEYYEDINNILMNLRTLGVEVLDNRVVYHGEAQIIGIDDKSDPSQVERVLPTLPLQSGFYSILLYHRPHGIESAAKHGVDLKLSGHTHKGQIKPFDFFVRRVFKRYAGLYRHEDAFLYVNQGTGTWGPTLRLGTISEITLFQVEPYAVP